MNWWPWQPKQVPARTAGDTGVSEPRYYDNSACGETLAHGTYGGMNHADLDHFFLTGQARRPGPGDIEFYRNRARSAEAEARKLRAALLEIACAPQPLDDGDRSEWKAALMIAVGLAERALVSK